MSLLTILEYSLDVQSVENSAAPLNGHRNDLSLSQLLHVKIKNPDTLKASKRQAPKLLLMAE